MKHWTKEDTEELRRIFRTMTAEQLAGLFGTTAAAIRQKCYRLGLKKGYDSIRIILPESDKLWLKINFPHMSNEICAMKLGVSIRTVVRLARRYGFEKTPQFMKECQAHAARKAKESHLRNGTYPAKGWYSPNLRKGELYRFKAKTRCVCLTGGR